jgi:hypothetical protein
VRSLQKTFTEEHKKPKYRKENNKKKYCGKISGAMRLATSCQPHAPKTKGQSKLSGHAHALCNSEAREANRRRLDRSNGNRRLSYKQGYRHLPGEKADKQQTVVKVSSQDNRIPVKA